MLSMNRATLLGHAGRNPEMRKLRSGDDVATFSLATTERFTRKDGTVGEATEWHSIVAFGGAAEAVRKLVRKGDPVLVEGRISTRSWTDKKGVERRTTEIVVAGPQAQVNVFAKRRRSTDGDGGDGPPSGTAARAGDGAGSGQDGEAAEAAGQTGSTAGDGGAAGEESAGADAAPAGAAAAVPEGETGGDPPGGTGTGDAEAGTEAAADAGAPKNAADDASGEAAEPAGSAAGTGVEVEAAPPGGDGDGRE